LNFGAFFIFCILILRGLLPAREDRRTVLTRRFDPPFDLATELLSGAGDATASCAKAKHPMNNRTQMDRMMTILSADSKDYNTSRTAAAIASISSIVL
jgi:hypothetical protein